VVIICGRYSVLTEDEIIEVRSIIQEISMRLVKDDMDSYIPPPGEIRPTDKAPVITRNDDGIAFESAKFGFKGWDGKGVIINARSETIAEKGMFNKLLSTGRCVVPAGEYYEWREQAEADSYSNKKKKSKKKKIKHFITDREGNMLFFAGLYRDGDEGREFVIITKDASGAVAEVHDRMPVILRVNQLEAWLSGGLAPEDIITMDFDSAAVAPCCEGDADTDGKDESNGQLSLF
jgi:putative SOS response-associated peptidase YedK